MVADGIAMARPRWRRFHAVVLPLAWTAIATLNFNHPGDEYGGFAVGSLAGTWIIFLLPSQGAPIKALLPILLAGATTVTVLGLILDRLRSPRVVWMVLAIVSAAVLFGLGLSAFDSYERAIAKNGSLTAYILPSLNLGLLLASLVMIVITGGYRMVTFRRAPAHSPTSL